MAEFIRHNDLSYHLALVYREGRTKRSSEKGRHDTQAAVLYQRG